MESSTSEGASGGVVEAGPSGNESPSLLQTLNQNTNYEDVPVEDVLQEVVVTHGVDGGQLLPHPSNPGEEGPSNNPGDGGSSSVEQPTGERSSATVAHPSTSSGVVRQIYNIARVETDDEGTDEDSAGGGEIPGSEEEEDSEEEFSTDGPSSDEGGGTTIVYTMRQ